MLMQSRSFGSSIRPSFLGVELLAICKNCNVKETTGGEFRIYRATMRLLYGIYTFYKAPVKVTTHLKMS